ncbi:hypothetical protein LP420_27765 [Massilia sp. B-10]|nr:hypothetical protein LP420_27765 [Massilia sp. B-10]
MRAARCGRPISTPPCSTPCAPKSTCSIRSARASAWRCASPIPSRRGLGAQLVEPSLEEALMAQRYAQQEQCA